jgi:hypothetical protein
MIGPVWTIQGEIQAANDETACSSSIVYQIGRECTLGLP